jgi:hypothetical protein
MKIKKMISNQVPACRMPDEGKGGWLFEIKTNGDVMWFQPHRMDEAIDIFFDSFKVSEEIQDEFRTAMKSSKVPMELMEKVFWRGAE